MPVTDRQQHKARKVPIGVRLSRGKQWVKGMAPYVGKTLTLQRPIANVLYRRRTSCAGLDEYFALTVNEQPQWLRIRGQSKMNPVLLYLHGGPGGSQIPSYRHYQLPWEEHFTVVHWEQRGTGKSWSRTLNPKTMTLPQLIADAKEVINFLHQRFAHCPIILLGHSWGTFLAAHLLQDDLPGVAAYIGVGQVGDQPKAERVMWRFALDAAEQNQNQPALAALRFADYPVANPMLHAQVGAVRRWASHYGYLGSTSEDAARTYQRLMNTPEYSLYDIYRFLQGTLLSSFTLSRTLLCDQAAQPVNLDLRSRVPVHLVSGERDHYTPLAESQAWLSSIEAPEVSHVTFAKSGHYPNEDEPDRFLARLREIMSCL